MRIVAKKKQPALREASNKRIVKLRTTGSGLGILPTDTHLKGPPLGQLRVSMADGVWASFPDLYIFYPTRLLTSSTTLCPTLG